MTPAAPAEPPRHLVDVDDTPVVLDISPCLRPARWSSAIVVADAGLWHGAPLDLAADFVESDLDRDLFGRALIHRMVAEQLADDPRRHESLAAYRTVVEHITR